MKKPRTEREKAAVGQGNRKSRTIGLLTLQREIARTMTEYPTDIERPKTRADCASISRPCPWVSCRYNLYCDITDFGGLTLNYPGLEPDEVEHSCALDIAGEGGHSMEDIGRILRTCRQMVWSIEKLAKAKVLAVEQRRKNRDEENLLDQWKTHKKKHT